MENAWWFTAFVPPILAGLVVAFAARPEQFLGYGRWVRLKVLQIYAACVFRWRLPRVRSLALQVLEAHSPLNESSFRAILDASEQWLTYALADRALLELLQQRRVVFASRWAGGSGTMPFLRRSGTAFQVRRATMPLNAQVRAMEIDTLCCAMQHKSILQEDKWCSEIYRFGEHYTDVRKDAPPCKECWRDPLISKQVRIDDPPGDF